MFQTILIQNVNLEYVPIFSIQPFAAFPFHSFYRSFIEVTLHLKASFFNLNLLSTLRIECSLLSQDWDRGVLRQCFRFTLKVLNH